MRTRLSCWSAAGLLSMLLPGCGTPPAAEPPPQAPAPEESTPRDLTVLDFCMQSQSQETPFFELFLEKGTAHMIGTCGVTGARTTGDTELTVYYAPQGGLVAYNDWTPAPGCEAGSRADFVAPETGAYRIRYLCAYGQACCASIGHARRVELMAFATRNTNNASLNYHLKQLRFEAGDVVRVSTCAAGAFGALATGDTYLRFFRQSAGVFHELAASDNAPGCGAAAELLVTIPTTGYYQLRVGCALNTACSGDVAVYVE
ncbi:hypothetical protein [Myxococcus landrumensis]|uniref:Lipoprotein n=1 Tax=Myxococcus landrumensis TaxID=2813577 RepID=A0ABX7NGM1_9BACT|nr:hypothetical protein [Myxococcus landrumus]QSQ17793.1 hypothetical protein JY572_17920 [Myxococcus landrumus]